MRGVSRVLVVLSALLGGLAMAGGVAAIEPGFYGVGDLPGGGDYSVANGLSADGSTVVGYSYSASGQEAFVWDAKNGIRGLGDLPGNNFSSVAEGVSADGSVVVGQSESSMFRWDASTGMQEFDPASRCSDCSGNDVSDDGSVIVGRGPGIFRTGTNAQAFRWTATTGMQGLGFLSSTSFNSQALATSGDGRMVVGSSTSDRPNPVNEAFLWDATNGMRGLGDLPGGGFWSIAAAISAGGRTVVGQSLSDRGYEPFIWDEENGMRPLVDREGFYFPGSAQGVSADGSAVIGIIFYGAGSQSQYFENFLWTEKTGMLLVRDVLEQHGIDTTGWRLSVCCVPAAGISDDGRVLSGTGLNPEGKVEAWVAVLPEPPVPIEIDIKPGSDTNPIRLSSRGIVPVLIFGSDEFLVDDIDTNTLAFGPGGASPVDRQGGHRFDADGDGFVDLLSHYWTAESGIALGDVEACVTGETMDGTPFEGCDAIRTLPACGSGFELALVLPGVIWLRRRRRRGIA